MGWHASAPLARAARAAVRVASLAAALAAGCSCEKEPPVRPEQPTPAPAATSAAAAAGAAAPATAVTAASSSDCVQADEARVKEDARARAREESERVTREQAERERIERELAEWDAPRLACERTVDGMLAAVPSGTKRQSARGSVEASVREVWARWPDDACLALLRRDASACGDDDECRNALEFLEAASGGSAPAGMTETRHRACVGIRGAPTCDALQAALLARDAARCPSDSVTGAVCRAIVRLDVAICAKSADADFQAACRREVARRKAIATGGVAALASGGDSEERMLAAAALGRPEECATHLRQRGIGACLRLSAGAPATLGTRR